jgi:hypothetical protein
MIWSRSSSVSTLLEFCQNLEASTNSATWSSRFSLNKRMSSLSSRNLRKLVTTSSGNAASRIVDACANVSIENEFGGRLEDVNSRRGRNPESDGDAGRGSWCRVGLGSIARKSGIQKGGEGKDAVSGGQTVDVIDRATSNDSGSSGGCQSSEKLAWATVKRSAYQALKASLRLLARHIYTSNTHALVDPMTPQCCSSSKRVRGSYPFSG